MLVAPGRAPVPVMAAAVVEATVWIERISFLTPSSGVCPR